MHASKKKPAHAANGSQSSKSAQPKTSISSFLNTLHPAVRYLFDNAPVLWFESRDVYDALFFALHAEYEPVSTTESILVKDLADSHWEVTRLQRIKKAAIGCQLPASAWRLMGSAFEHKIAKHIDTREFLNRTLREVVNGSAEALEILKEYQNFADVSDDALLHEAYISDLTTLSAIEAALARAERRRISLLRTLEQRKHSNNAINRAYFEGMVSQSMSRKLPGGSDASHENDA